MTTSHTTEQRLHAILADVLGLSSARLAALTPATGLFGAMPELDSMAVAGLLTEIEDHFQIIIDDDEVNGDMLESLGSLTHFISTKLAQKPSVN
jgi:acyl carrier protein